MSQLAEIANLKDKSDLAALLKQPGVLIDIDRSGLITAEEMAYFLNELASITVAQEKKERFLHFNHKIRNKGCELKPRLFNKKSISRFKLSKIQRKYGFVLTDGEG
jgi:hypothetical protein